MVCDKKFLEGSKFLVFYFVALGGASLAAEERGAAKPRGRGLGQHNIFFSFFFATIQLMHCLRPIKWSLPNINNRNTCGNEMKDKIKRI